MGTKRTALALWPITLWPIALWPIAILAVITGCAEPQPELTDAAPTAVSTAPVFASDEEALAAAEEAFAAYMTMSNTVAHEGGANPERLEDFVTGAALQSEIESFKKMAEAGLHGVGNLISDSIALQKSDFKSGATVIYLCLDTSRTDIIDATGATTLSEDRDLRFPFEVSLIFTPDREQLVIERSEIWTGTNFC
jgi:hypothetical protein